MRVQAVQRTVGMNLVKLWDASDQPGLNEQLVQGGLLFTQLAQLHSFDCTGNATQVSPHLLAFLPALVVLCRDLCLKTSLRCLSVPSNLP